MTVRFAHRRRQLGAALYVARRLGLAGLVRQGSLNRRYAVASISCEDEIEAMWLEAARELGAETRRLSDGFLEFELDEVRACVRYRVTPLADRVAAELAADKPLAYRLLAEKGVPVPRHVVLAAWDMDGARSFLETAKAPLVAKPAWGSGGAGVVGGIHTARQLARALAHVGRVHPCALLEEQIEGDCYRLLFLDGDLLDVLRRVGPRIVGDGSSTIRSLVLRECGRRLDAGGPRAGHPPLVLGLDSLTTLEQLGLGPRSVLPEGASVRVASASNHAAWEEVESLRAEAVGGVLEPARAAVAVLGVRLAGVDVVTSDPQRPLAGCGAVLEVNPFPGLLPHALVRDPAVGRRVASSILAALLGSGVTHDREATWT